MKVFVLRLGHRFCRDRRLSTHVALTARAFGACEVVFDAVDSHVKKSIDAVNLQWGGSFGVSHTCEWKKYVKEFNGDVIHLTMYGLELNKVMPLIRRSKRDKLVIIGSQKVPPEAYKMADFNVSVGGQPHSEVAALAVFLDRLSCGKELSRPFSGGKFIVPQACGKKVVEPSNVEGKGR
jgi:tRNA (cytidine56-2'-O)-methyltransferase